MTEYRLAGVVRPIDALTQAALYLSALCLFALFGFILSEVIARNIFGRSISFSWDYAAYMMGAVFFLASGAALRNGVHVRVTALREVLAPGMRRALDILACLIGIATVAMILWALAEMAWLSYGRGSRAATVSKTPLWLPQAAMAAGALVLWLQMIAQTLRVLAGGTLHGDAAE
ncbi:TRAP transporter small permease subunit [Tranquillimonas rosea]|uniref:TRAP transporter small permease subunit n=1 Tax=Tranquillimonas rosea TaxID=641238 RepID=UPI003BAB203D